jgi:predicted N-acetyltransferase YhbS
MNLTLRLETHADHRAVEELTREAFWGFTSPTCDEHYLVHLLRQAPSFVPELDYVAEADGRLVGNIVYSRAKVVDAQGVEHEVLTFGPLSVLPEHWNSGVGSALMRHTIAEAKRLGYRGIVVYGHPDYYPRFGFRSAEAYGITTPGGKSFDALMALPLWEGALDGISGAFHEDPSFNMDAEEAAAYNRNFPPKEPAEMLPISVLLDRLEPRSRQAFIDREITTLAWLNRYSGREMLTWDGIDEDVLRVINRTLREHGYAEKLFPTSEIFRRAQVK